MIGQTTSYIFLWCKGQTCTKIHDDPIGSVDTDSKQLSIQEESENKQSRQPKWAERLSVEDTLIALPLSIVVSPDRITSNFRNWALSDQPPIRTTRKLYPIIGDIDDISAQKAARGVIR